MLRLVCCSTFVGHDLMIRLPPVNKSGFILGLTVKICMRRAFNFDGSPDLKRSRGNAGGTVVEIGKYIQMIDT